jgi:hypothetical protein
MNLVIDRKKWYRGLMPSRSELLRKEDGKMCCLGFMMKECGLQDHEIQGVAYPLQLCLSGVPKYNEVFQKLFHKMYNDLIDHDRDSQECTSLIATNDGEMPEEKRESKLKKIFKSIGVNVLFK